MEFIDIYDENNNPLGYKLERKIVHEKNLWHRHASCWIMNEKGEILLQQRSYNKKKNPGCFSKTGGHVSSGETPYEAIKREVLEEIGLQISDDKIIEIDIFKSNNNEHYFSYGYIVFTNLKENEFILQKEEVESVKYFTIEQLEEYKRLNDVNFTFNKWNTESFFEQMNILKKYRNFNKLWFFCFLSIINILFIYKNN